MRIVKRLGENTELSTIERDSTFLAAFLLPVVSVLLGWGYHQGDTVREKTAHLICEVFASPSAEMTMLSYCPCVL